MFFLLAFDSECFIYDVDYKDNNVDELKGITSAGLCRQECQKNLKCKMFAWVSDEFRTADYRQNCYLKNVSMEMSKMVTDLGVVSGLRHCRKYYNLFDCVS